MSKEILSVDELFDQLKPFYFLEYIMLEKIVKFFLLRTHSIADDLHDYLEQLECFKTSTTIRQFMESIEHAQQSHQSHCRSTTSERPRLCTVKLCLIGGWLDRTMDDLEKLLNEIFQDKRYVLTHLKIVRGSVIMTFSAPLPEAESLIVLLLEQSSFALQVGVSQLVVADTVITQSESSDSSFESFLLDSVKHNDLNLLKFLLSINTNPNAADQSNQTALHVASELNHGKSMILLLQANANPNLKDNEGRTPLYIACREGHIQIVALLLENKANVETYGYTPLYIASQNGHTDIISLLLKTNENLDIFDVYDSIGIASNTDTFSLLCEAYRHFGSYGFTPLYVASEEGHAKVVFLLLEANADPNIQSSNDYYTPLCVASLNGHTDVVSLLLRANADPNLQSRNNCTPLNAASMNGHTDVITLLLKANADPNLQSVGGFTPLYAASDEGHAKVVSLLLEANADPNFQSRDSYTPLYAASRNNHTDIISLLLKANADPNLAFKESKVSHLFMLQVVRDILK